MSVELWTIALVPKGPDAEQVGIDANDLRRLAVYIRSNGLKIEGIRIAVSEAHNSGPPAICRIRRLLKYALRAVDLRCREIKQVMWEKSLENPRASCATKPAGHNKGQIDAEFRHPASGQPTLRAAG